MVDRTRLIVLGRQGAGKGTQCARLAARLSVPHVSTGDLFRAEAARGTQLGLQAATYLDVGALVPDGLVLDLVARRLASADARAVGYLLDGFPRTLPQGQALFEVLGKRAADMAVELHVPTSVVLPRLAARRVCLDCGTNSRAAPGDPDVTTCDHCGGTVNRRTDDTDEAINRRLATYDRESGPLLAWLKDRDLLVRVDGVGEPDIVHHRLLDAVRTRIPAIATFEQPGRGNGSDMALNLNSVMLGSEDPKRLADFYQGVLGAANPEWSDEANGWFGFQAGDGGLAVGPHSEVKGKSQQPGRIMLNFETADVSAEFERIKAVGADVVAEPYNPGGGGEMLMCTFADPDGNYFQLSTPWNPE